MIWIIASVPFWITGILFLLSAPCALAIRYRGETRRDQIYQFLLTMFLADISLVIAAKLSS